jgi:acetyl esterase/lipase
MPQPSKLSYGEHRAQFGELYRPVGASAGTVVVIHGGFWRSLYNLSLGRPLALDLVARGYTVWNLEYRRVGAGGGWPYTLTDVAAGIDRLADLDVDTDRVVAVGHSAGGHLAVWAAGRPGLTTGVPGADPRVVLRAAVSQAGVVGLAEAARSGVGNGAVTDLIGGDPETAPARYAIADPTAHLPVDAAVLCVHARADDSVPFWMSEQYVDAAQNAGGRATLAEAPGDHFTLIDPATRDWGLVVAALPGLLN